MMKTQCGANCGAKRLIGSLAYGLALFLSVQQDVVQAGGDGGSRLVAQRAASVPVDSRDTSATTSNQPPVPVFTVEPGLTGVIGQEFTFDASGSSDPDSDPIRFAWSFGDGTDTQYSTVATAIHSYDQNGSYIVRLAVRDQFNATTNLTKTIQVLGTTENQPPVAVIATGPRDVAQGDVVTFDGSLSYDPDGNPLTYTWTFHFGNTLDEVLTGVKVNKTFSDLGTYTVDLLVSDIFGAVTDAPTETVTVHERTTVEPPPTEKPPTQPEEPPDSANQRPAGTSACGIGMLPALFASLAGLQLIRRSRRR
ncbi:MAG: PKD domain-containing protein [Planctomycetes bacterium]|nr:PKD domain-containing protein [Planctomycetota bacterium]MBI3835329.1 PKD domain-containing protein [Planctomycetota bacterium]